jgi:hypothetical protein
MITKKKQRKLHNTISLLSSMVSSGEQHSETSRKAVAKAQVIVKNLPIAGVGETCDHNWVPCTFKPVQEFDECSKCGKVR